MLPNLAKAVKKWQQPIIIKTVKKTFSNFVTKEVVTREDYNATVQPTKKTIINKDSLDWSQKNYTFHLLKMINLGDFIEYKGQDFKIVEVSDCMDYGFCEAVGQATNKDLL
jgi:thiaminase